MTFCRVRCLVAALMLVHGALTAGRAEAQSFGLARALDEAGNLALLQQPADPPRRFVQLSSWDRNFANFDQGNFLREEAPGEMVMMDAQGPGVLTRLWAAEPMGLLRFYWDGAEKPQFEVLWTDLQAGRFPPITEPFVSERGGGTMRFPLPFEKGLKVTLAGQTSTEWQIHYQYFAPETKVESWWPAPNEAPPPGAPAAYTRAAEAWEAPASVNVARDEVLEMQVHQFAGAPPTLFEAEFDMLVTALTFDAMTDPPLPAELHFVIEPARGEGLSVPWNGLTGIWDSPHDSESLLFGRCGMRSYFRVPFVVRKGDRMGFAWAPRHDTEADSSDSTEVFGTLRVSALRDFQEPAPELVVSSVKERVPGAEPLRFSPLEGNGRLIALSLHASAGQDDSWLERDELIQIDNAAPIRGTSIPALFDSAGRFGAETFSSPTAILSVCSKDGLDIGGATAWWPLGIAFAESLRVELAPEESTLSAPVDVDALLIGQRFPEQVTLPTPPEEVVPLLVATNEPKSMRLARDEIAEGRFRVELPTDEVAALNVRLHLPFGWRGTLAGGGEHKEVFDIGWPPIELREPGSDALEFEWTATPPEVLAAGNWLIQLEAEVALPDGSNQSIKHPVAIVAAPRGEAEVGWDSASVERNANGELIFELPAGFLAEPGDVFAIGFRASAPEGWRRATAQLSWDPATTDENSKDFDEEIAALLPEDGTAKATMWLEEGSGWAAFNVGNYQTWPGPLRELRLALPESITGFELLAARLHRLPAAPPVEGWRRRIPYEEISKGAFRLPKTKVMLEEAELRKRIRRIVATPADHLDPEFRPRHWLENVEAAPLKWRIAETLYRNDWMGPAVSYNFESQWGGERIAIFDERFAGEQFFAFQFGFGPMCGRVGVRDCEGRLVAVHDLYMNVPAVFPQYFWVALPVPSRDGWIYLEAMGPAPGSHGQHIPLQKVMVVGNEPWKDRRRF